MTQANILAASGTQGVSQSMKNRIINGAMIIDQRNAGASVTQTTSDVYPVDRWRIGGSVTSKFTAQQNSGSVTPPSGFVNYVGCVSSSAYSVLTGDYFFIDQPIEGFNTADLAWGTADAKTVTFSFWVRSSLTGTFGGSVKNNTGNRSYPFTYTISSANTWEQKSVTITGCPDGTWLTTSGVGIRMIFGLGVGATYSGTAGTWGSANYISATGATSVVGTSGATFYITGVQLEVGTSATNFEYRQYGQELALCQRYLPVVAQGTNDVFASGYVGGATTQFRCFVPFKVPARSAATGLTASTASTFNVQAAVGGGAASAVSFNLGGINGAWVDFTSSAGTVGQSCFIYGNTSTSLLYFTGCEL